MSLWLGKINGFLVIVSNYFAVGDWLKANAATRWSQLGDHFLFNKYVLSKMAAQAQSGWDEL